MDLQIIIGTVIGVLIIFALIKIISLPFWLLKNSIIGAIILYVINFIGIFTIKVTFIHCLIVGVFGVPGIVVLYIYLNYLK
ncbi:MAG: pro-sigmaK processing inhibitor BofA family protein [Selenomonadaceae bacterium]|nr:pro-sigmaK processing inhibitor BofA family protein [Selenomonadaceae bacterium]